MGYVFKRNEAVAPNIHRILVEQVQAAIESLENPGEAKGEAIHGVRKRIKKIRAVFRLIRSELKPGVFERANTHYRTLGQRLSQLRDATVMINTLEKLRQAYSNKVSPNVFATLRKTLADQQEQVSHAFFDDPTNIGTVAKAFHEAPLSVAGLGKHTKSFSVMKPNLKAIYRRGRKALHIAKDEPSIHNLHELRKEVKTIWYHTRLLEPIWPGLLGAYGDEFARLGELLGDDHDFGVLAQEIESGRLLLRNKQSRATVIQGLHEQRTTLQAQIHPLADRLFAEKANAFVNRYRLYWKLWQKQKNH